MAGNRTDIKFTFDTLDDPPNFEAVFDGEWDGTYWNGWPNLWVKKPEFDRLVQAFKDQATAGDTEWIDEWIEEGEVDADGYVCMGWGSTPTIIEQ